MSNPLNPNRRWTPEDTEYAWLVCARCHREDSPVQISAIATKLHRSPASISGKLNFLMRDRWKYKHWPTDYNYIAIQDALRARAHTENDTLLLGQPTTTTK